jgi:hypothetical protein
VGFKLIRLVVIVMNALFLLGLWGAHDQAQGASRVETLEYENGLMSLSADQAPIMPVLDRITEAADIDVFVFDDVSRARVTADFEDRPLGDALHSVLKGYSYAVVYYSESGAHGGRTMLQFARARSERSPRRGRGGGSGLRPKPLEAYAARTDTHIEMLERRIAEGISDREYDRWVKIRGPEYAVHDRERLKWAKQRLSGLK